MEYEIKSSHSSRSLCSLQNWIAWLTSPSSFVISCKACFVLPMRPAIAGGQKLSTVNCISFQTTSNEKNVQRLLMTPQTCANTCTHHCVVMGWALHQLNASVRGVRLIDRLPTANNSNKLKPAGVSQTDLVYCYQAVIRPVLEYACPVWHTSITGQQSKQPESIQRLAFQIILNDMKYKDACIVLGLPSRHERRHELRERLFHQLTRNTSNWLYYLLPDMRNSTITNRLRSAKQLLLIFAKINKLKNSFIRYGLVHYQ